MEHSAHSWGALPTPLSFRSIARYSLLLFITLVGLLCLSIPGGLLNHIRGGWLNFPGRYLDDGSNTDYWVSHFLSRTVFALPTAALVYLLITLQRYHARVVHRARLSSSSSDVILWSIVAPRGHLTRIVFAVTQITLFVGWGCYMGIGRNDSKMPRLGVFDWFLGRPDVVTTSFERRYWHDMVGMSWRGLIWTVPQGLCFYVNGYSPLYMLSGAAMGFIYDLGWRLPSFFTGFGTGIGLAEPLWGTWIWLCLYLTLCETRRLHDFSMYITNDSITESAAQSHRDSDHSLNPSDSILSAEGALLLPKKRYYVDVKYDRLKKRSLAFVCVVAIVCLVFFTSSIYYAFAYENCNQGDDTDWKNFGQTFGGTMFAAAFIVVLSTFYLSWYKIYGLPFDHFITRRGEMRRKERFRESIEIFDKVEPDEDVRIHPLMKSIRTVESDLDKRGETSSDDDDLRECLERGAEFSSSSDSSSSEEEISPRTISFADGYLLWRRRYIRRWRIIVEWATKICFAIVMICTVAVALLNVGESHCHIADEL